MGKPAGQTVSHGRIRSAPAGAWNSLRGLTRSSGTSREGLGMKPTRSTVHTRRATPDEPLSSRILRRVERRPDGCWIWVANKARGGYGLLRNPHTGRSQQAHRAAYEAFVGPIPEGMWVDHTCYVPACVNPEHLRAVTPKQNAENRSKPRRADNRSGYPSVHWTSQRGKWMVRVQHDGRAYFGGYFTDVHEAGAAARDLRNRLFTHNDIDRREAS